MVEAPESYNQIITGTLTPRFESIETRLQEIIYGFKENAIGSEPPPPSVKKYK